MAALDALDLLDTPAEAAFDRLTRMATMVLGVPVALVSLVTPDRQFFKSQCGLSAPYDVSRQTPLSHSFCQHVVASERDLVITDAREHPELARNLAIPDLDVIAYAGFPLRAPGGEVIGSFCAIDDRPHDWTSRELDLVRGLADAANDIVALRAEAVAAADAAHHLQRAVAPSIPTLARTRAAAIYRPGEQRLLLGGDFFSCEEQGDGTLEAVIADVAGHGAEAAAHAIMLRSSWLTLLLDPSSLELRVARLNALAVAQQPSVRLFTTALFIELDPNRRLARIVSAGHPPPVLVEAAGGRELPVVPGPPLGVVQTSEWPTFEHPLDGNERLLAYTDGLIEGRASPGNPRRLGIGPIVELLAGSAGRTSDGDELLHSLVAHAMKANGGPLADDVAALLLGWRDGAVS